MTAASDKARFYLEQYVPELQEYAQKRIFSSDEIAAISSKRSHFEHILNARGSAAADFARYATYEMNLDSLRKKRCKRLGFKSTQYSGQRTVFFILDRATKKFPGDIGLWVQYIEYCRKEKANKKLTKVFTQVLRLKPREYGLWVLAAKYFAESQGDMSSARIYLQQGLRFCQDKMELWLEYTRLEIVYLAKIAARRKILGLDEKPKTAAEDQCEDVIALPTITMEDIDPGASEGINQVDLSLLEKIAAAPAFAGAIPIAIFDAAMKQFAHKPRFAEQYLDLVFSLNHIPASSVIIRHVLSYLQSTSPTSPEAIICNARSALYGIDPVHAEFPVVLSSALSMINKGISETSGNDVYSLAEKALLMLVPHLTRHSELDPDIVTVLEASINRYLRLITHHIGRYSVTSSQVRSLVQNFENRYTATEISSIIEQG